MIIPKYRRKRLYGSLRRQVGRILRELCRQKGIELVEGHAMPDHVHLCLAIPPKFSVAFTIEFLKGKSAVQIHRQLERDRRVAGKHFWARGYCVSTVGLDERQIRRYIQEQEKLDSGQSTLNFEYPPNSVRRGLLSQSPFRGYISGAAPFGGLPDTTCYAGGSSFVAVRGVGHGAQRARGAPRHGRGGG